MANNARGHHHRKKPLADKPMPERVQRAREKSERGIEPLDPDSPEGIRVAAHLSDVLADVRARLAREGHADTG